MPVALAGEGATLLLRLTPLGADQDNGVCARLRARQRGRHTVSNRRLFPLKNGAGIPIPFKGIGMKALKCWYSISVMERVRILSLKSLSRRQQMIIRAGQQEVARVWTLCRDLH